MYRLTKKENEILHVLWNTSRALTAKQISETSDSLGMNAVQSSIKKLLEKGIVERSSSCLR